MRVRQGKVLAATAEDLCQALGSEQRDQPLSPHNDHKIACEEIVEVLCSMLLDSAGMEGLNHE